ncbi:unnamed protein product [Echinostoma caproni]|uniref:SMP-LTD domain-containing protein n=1 Tax=Echinostoma caproni TaxID=27848 RepID=A0A3P8HF70_9TREM|nr:unnamed protein product [Echinostoma caproni]
MLTTFLWGLVCGVAIVYVYLLIRSGIRGDADLTGSTKCPISGSPLSQFCCSLHNQITKGVGIKDIWWPIYAPALPSLNATTTTNNYDPETHHVSQTHSVFVTLDGTQLRLQRPRRNIARRSMWNEELPSITTMRFQQQRIFDLVHARVTLLPTGLVLKRLWSKKYPIAITIPKKSKNSPGSRPSLPSSTSVPNMTSSITQPASPEQTGSDTPSRSRSPTPANGSDVVDDFTMISRQDLPSETLYLFGRTCREKETWYARLRAASLGIPLLWTPQLAVQTYLAASAGTNSSTTAGGTVPTGDNRSDDESVPEKENASTVSSSDGGTSSIDRAGSQLPIPGSREPLYVTYVRYMAKYMPASWLLRGTQALRLNVNYVSCEPHVLWLNALLARVFWDFLREVYWLERVRDKIQAKLKKIHLPPFISDLIVVGIDLGTELPVIRRVGRPFLDAHGLWFELDVAYAGGFSVALETNVNLMRWNQKSRESTMLADDLSSTSPPPAAAVIPSDPNLNSFVRRSNRLGAFLSDEEDSADSTTDSDSAIEPLQPPGRGPPGLRRSSGSGRLLASSIGLVGLSNRSVEEDRAPSLERSCQQLSFLIHTDKFFDRTEY